MTNARKGTGDLGEGEKYGWEGGDFYHNMGGALLRVGGVAGIFSTLGFIASCAGPVHGKKKGWEGGDRLRDQYKKSFWGL